LLRSGAFISSSIESATPTAVAVSGRFKEKPISTVNIARLIFQPLSQQLVARLSPGRTGLLLAKGDFIDGEFRGLAGGKLKLSSVLLGVQTYDARAEVLAVSLRETAPNPALFQVHLRDQSFFPVTALRVENNRLLIPEPALGLLEIPTADLSAIVRRRPAILPARQ
jgi:hypothetical protein